MFDALNRFILPHMATAATVPAGARLYAIGDVHGRADLLRDLLVMIADDDGARGAAETRLVFLGDLIDRGPDSAGVVDLAMTAAARYADTRFLMGNHEEVLLDLIDGDTGVVAFFLRIGGQQTLNSYGISDAEIDAMDDAALVDRVRAAVPTAHVAFLRGFQDVVVVGDYAFVHAGIRPGVALADQSPSDLRWIRQPFLRHRQPFERFVIHGHTITPAVDQQPNRIGIDTGAFDSGRLTAIGLEGTDRWFIATGD